MGKQLTINNEQLAIKNLEATRAATDMNQR
jgi:hypothetical protein